MTEDHEREQRKRYEAPKVTAISLRPEEAVLGHCKAQNTHGASNVGNCNHMGPCVSLGS